MKPPYYINYVFAYNENESSPDKNMKIRKKDVFQFFFHENKINSS